MTQTTLIRSNRRAEDAARDWLEAKADEAAANARRLAVEQELITLLGAKLEGAETHKIEGFKVTITGKLDRKLDDETYVGIENKIPPEFRPVERKTVLAIDIKGARWLADNRPDLYGLFAQAMTVKPAKTSVSVSAL